MRRTIEYAVWPHATSTTIDSDNPDPGEVEWRERTEPIRRGDDVAELLGECAALVLRNYSDGNAPQQFTPLFCPICETLLGVENDFEVFKGEYHTDGRLTGRGAKLQPYKLECDEPGCSGVIEWIPKSFEKVGMQAIAASPLPTRTTGNKNPPAELLHELTSQQGKIVTHLWNAKHATNWQSLPDDCWRDGRSTSDQTDRAIESALERLRDRLNSLSTFGLTLEVHSAKQTTKLQHNQPRNSDRK